MKRTRVKSTSIDSVGYRERSRTLLLWYVGADTYRYEYLDVPPAEVRSLIGAQSIGAYVNRCIKPRYKCHRRSLGPRNRRAVGQ